ncbi:hypothetical protein BTUL_0192g00220 [Botrytis tulipae]|uniref:Uncharacterized protein n=3 Tax=Sclerotiniaceae TaxID=28983 RepID=A0A4Z1HYM0_9HELO|nr:hypothetical protein BTUL_0192g00220 [Botrytis tulipae]TGO54191.1 hypothetical protein BOTNAR_0275g00020 [Botryotinia narcissicola]THV47602.1 hypothetical protein BGAL_0300g00080 [Botrytis galanthina]
MALNAMERLPRDILFPPSWSPTLAPLGVDGEYARNTATHKFLGDEYYPKNLPRRTSTGTPGANPES